MYRSRITLTCLLLYLSAGLTVPGSKVGSVLDVVCGILQSLWVNV